MAELFHYIERGMFGLQTQSVINPAAPPYSLVRKKIFSENRNFLKKECGVWHFYVTDKKRDCPDHGGSDLDAAVCDG